MTVKQRIIGYLGGKDWVFGGLIEDYIRSQEGHSKGSSASRECRQLAKDGKLERRLVKVQGLNVVQYRHATKPTPKTPSPVQTNHSSAITQESLGFI